MITEDYVSFETAKLLKEKGFDEVCFRYAESKGIYESGNWTVANVTGGGIGVPTLQMAIKWLREVHHYYIQVMLDSWALGDHMGYYVVIQKTDSDFEMMLSDARERVFYDTPEESAEDAIMYIAETLI